MSMMAVSRSGTVAAMHALLFIGLWWAFSTASAAEEPDRRELIRLVRQDCGSCHGMTLQGGLGTPLTRDALAGKPAESLASTILYGRPGTAMPPWKTLLTEEQANWIAAALLAGFPEETR